MKKFVGIGALCLVCVAILIFAFLPKSYADGREMVSADGKNQAPTGYLWVRKLNEQYKGTPYFRDAYSLLFGTKQGAYHTVALSENIIVAKYLGPMEEYSSKFELVQSVRGKVDIRAGWKHIEGNTYMLMDNFAQMNILHLREGDTYLLCMCGLPYSPSLVFNVTEEDATVADPMGKELFKYLPRNSEKLIDYFAKSENLSTIYMQYNDFHKDSPKKTLLSDSTMTVARVTVDKLERVFPAEGELDLGLEEKPCIVYFSLNDTLHGQVNGTKFAAFRMYLTEEQQKELPGKELYAYMSVVYPEALSVMGFLSERNIFEE